MIMNNPALNDWHRLFSGALNDTLEEAEKVELAALLKTNAEARQLWFLYHDNECGLAELRQPRALASPPKKATPRSRWLAWSPTTAAAAGLVIGLISASMVWGYVGPYSSRAVTVLADSFEAGTAPQVNGVPLEAGRWSGDFSEVVGEFKGVAPATGKRMLRFLRADYADKPGRDGYIADLFRIVDLRRAELDVASGDACVSVEALFRALPQPGRGRVLASVTIHALDELPGPDERHEFFLKPRDGRSPVEAGEIRPASTILATATRQEAYASSGGFWQSVRTELRLPPGTRYLMIHLHEWLLDSRGPREPQPVEFSGLFVDDVRVTLAHRPPLL